jgi:hypothetical protein
MDALTPPPSPPPDEPCLTLGHMHLSAFSAWGQPRWHCLDVGAAAAAAAAAAPAPAPARPLWLLHSGYEAKVSAPAATPARLRLGLRASACSGGALLALDTDDEKIMWPLGWPPACGGEVGGEVAVGGGGGGGAPPLLWLYVNATAQGLAVAGARGAGLTYDLALDGVAAGVLPHRVVAALAPALPLVALATVLAARALAALLARALPLEPDECAPAAGAETQPRMRRRRASVARKRA